MDGKVIGCTHLERRIVPKGKKRYVDILAGVRSLDTEFGVFDIDEDFTGEIGDRCSHLYIQIITGILTHACHELIQRKLAGHCHVYAYTMDMPEAMQAFPDHQILSSYYLEMLDPGAPTYVRIVTLLPPSELEYAEVHTYSPRPVKLAKAG